MSMIGGGGRGLVSWTVGCVDGWETELSSESESELESES